METKWVKAADGISFQLRQGETLGIVGESGCGKSTLVNTILCLEKATGGSAIFDGKNLMKLKQNDLRLLRKEIQIVFQDPFWSLDPRWLVKDIVGEPLKVFEKKMSVKDFIQNFQEMDYIDILMNLVQGNGRE